ncbi:SelL-related redox protein [Haliscomenobacter hydrossis]|uniref:Alkyl hydroperoxide reductase/thiol specific antioxidant/Mal allergen n=1 Tax=Haliscomenobacter hydrossis (strain ATCC 27775 / DSM 1100 / LMG 10767 / O) TaxID=760192 RepID=F4L544_HALH1|nr:SelL-related redox protein [Haliscomenobacter hydrossis]AEE48765.1 alkyl hydroperoxide reductase/thiol specific antioxidant/Mal allergen [Haliscomenobacter hydrossis DSM 1100]
MIPVGIQEEVLDQMITSSGESLRVTADKAPVLLVFLRHFGCVFCREALADISKRRKEIESTGTRIVFVHMTDNDIAERYFTRYDLGNAIHISDPECTFYRAFGLMKGNFNQLFGLHSWIRGFSAGVVAGHGAGPQLGDGFQMPGVFVIQNGEIRESFIHSLSSDRPDYEELLKCCMMD